MPVEVNERVSTEYTVRVGERLRGLRRQKGLSLRDVEAGSLQEFNASVLGSYERGRRAISVLRLQRLARFYNVPVEELLPPDLTSDLEPGATGAEGEINLQAEEVASSRTPCVMVDLVALEVVDAPEKDLLRRFLRMVQVQQRDFNCRVLTVRAEDVKVLALMLGLTPASLERRLEALDLKL